LKAFTYDGSTFTPEIRLRRLGGRPGVRLGARVREDVLLAVENPPKYSGQQRINDVSLVSRDGQHWRFGAPNAQDHGQIVVYCPGLVPAPQEVAGVPQIIASYRGAIVVLGLRDAVRLPDGSQLRLGADGTPTLAADTGETGAPGCAARYDGAASVPELVAIVAGGLSVLADQAPARREEVLDLLERFRVLWPTVGADASTSDGGVASSRSGGLLSAGPASRLLAQLPTRVASDVRVTMSGAILATDMVGAGAALNGLDSQQTLELMLGHYRLLHASVDRCHGRTISHLGDGVIAVFAEPEHAISCALDMQYTTSQAGHIIRVGISHGQVTIRDTEVFGAPALETCRLRNAAEPGHVLASPAAVQQTADLSDLVLADREISVKGLNVTAIDVSSS
jgi:class 3 adenylate cyclase